MRVVLLRSAAPNPLPCSPHGTRDLVALHAREHVGHEARVEQAGIRLDLPRSTPILRSQTVVERLTKHPLHPLFEPLGGIFSDHRGRRNAPRTDATKPPPVTGALRR